MEQKQRFIYLARAEKGAVPFILIFHSVVLIRFALVWTVCDHSVSRVSDRLPQALPGSGFPTANPARPTSAPATSSPAPLSVDLLLPVPATPLPFDLVLWPRCVGLPSIGLYRNSATLREQTQYRFYDSLIVAAAMAGEVAKLYTKDLQSDRIIGNLKITNPFLVILP